MSAIQSALNVTALSAAPLGSLTVLGSVLTASTALLNTVSAGGSGNTSASAATALTAQRSQLVSLLAGSIASSVNGSAQLAPATVLGAATLAVNLSSVSQQLSPEAQASLVSSLQLLLSAAGSSVAADPSGAPNSAATLLATAASNVVAAATAGGQNGNAAVALATLQGAFQCRETVFLQSSVDLQELI